MERWQTFDGEDDEAAAYGVWKREDLEVEARMSRRKPHPRSNERDPIAVKKKNPRRRRAR